MLMRILSARFCGRLTPAGALLMAHAAAGVIGGPTPRDQYGTSHTSLGWAGADTRWALPGVMRREAAVGVRGGSRLSGKDRREQGAAHSLWPPSRAAHGPTPVGKRPGNRQAE